MYRSLIRRLAVAAVLLAPLAVAHGEERFSDRLSALKLDGLTPEQQQMAVHLKTPPRNSALDGGPFNAYARSPSLGLLLLNVSDYVRFNSSLPPRLSEFAIMIGARHWSVPYEWRAHYPLAVKGGLERQILVDLGAGKRPQNMKDDEAALYDFVTEMYRDHDVSDATFKAVADRFGERGVMDLIGIIGYYDIASMALIAQRAKAPPIEDAPLVPIKR